LELIIWKSYSPWDGKKTEYSEERALNDFEMVKLLIENNAKVNSINSYGHTLLYDAFYTNNPKMVIYLIECGADINKANEDGNTPLHAAVDYGTLKEVKFLLKKGACVNARNGRRETPLHKVYADTHVEGARLLLSAGAHIDDADCNGNTVLHKSVRAKNVQMVKFLLDNGADLNKLNESGFENIIETYLYFRCWTRAENNDSALKDDFDCSINSKEISPFTLAYSIKNRKIKQPMLEAMEAVNEAKTKRKANALGTVVINQSGKSITDICKTTTVDTRSVHLPYNNLIVSARSSGAVAFLNYVQNNK
jgi:ankyrin repeat protein